MNKLTELHRVKTVLEWIANPADVFGYDEKNVAKQYKKLMKLYHPDSTAGTDDDVLANAIVSLVGDLYTKAKEQIEVGTYGTNATPNTVTIGTKTYELWSQIGTGDIADVFLMDNNCVMKIVRSSADNDLMDTEMKALQMLSQSAGYNDMMHFYPQLISPITFRDGGIRKAHIIQYDPDSQITPTNILSLKQLADYYQYDVHPKHVAWIWRRLLAALGFAHSSGIVHAAVFPENIMIEPETHAMVLVDWVYSSLNQNILTSYSAPHETEYPDELFQKKEPLPGLDIYLAANTMLKISKNMPDQMLKYFNWCTTASYLGRPQSAEVLLEEFDIVLRKTDGFWPRAFFAMNDLCWENGKFKHFEI